jgi:hypothetical protein
MRVKQFNNLSVGRPEGSLYDYVVRLDKLRERRTAIHIHISRLQPYNRREYNLRIATHVFDNMIGQHEGELFVLSNNDFVFIAEGVPRLHIDRSLERLRALFSEDPLVFNTDENDAFCTWYELETDYDRLLAHAKALMNRQATLDSKDTDIQGPYEPEILNKLDAKSLSDMEDVLSKADITNFVRNQAACVHTPGKIQAVFDELYVSIPDLQRMLLPHSDLRGNKWLFQYLTEVLDRRMLIYLKNMDPRPERMFSINLNISTVLSTEFQTYDNELTAHARGSNLVIELQKHDIFADMGAYIFAREYLHERKHKICLDGITHLTLPYIDRKMLKLDLIKLCFSAELLNNKARLMPSLREHVERIGPQRFILIHCDAPEAMDLGAELGISLFQGRYVSHLLARTRSRKQQKMAQ